MKLTDFIILIAVIITCYAFTIITIVKSNNQIKAELTEIKDAQEIILKLAE